MGGGENPAKEKKVLRSDDSELDPEGDEIHPSLLDKFPPFFAPIEKDDFPEDTGTFANSELDPEGDEIHPSLLDKFPPFFAPIEKDDFPEDSGTFANSELDPEGDEIHPSLLAKFPPFFAPIEKDDFPEDTGTFANSELDPEGDEIHPSLLAKFPPFFAPIEKDDFPEDTGTFANSELDPEGDEIHPSLLEKFPPFFAPIEKDDFPEDSGTFANSELDPEGDEIHPSLLDKFPPFFAPIEKDDFPEDTGTFANSDDTDDSPEDMLLDAGDDSDEHIEDMGRVIGGIVFEDRLQNLTDCTHTVANVPLDVDGFMVTNFSAKFVLLVDKLDLAMRLHASRFYSWFPCVIVVMGRALDYSTRKLLYMLNKGGGLKLQLFALLDCIPRSIKTMSDLIHYDQLDIDWLGIQPCDVPELVKARVLAGHTLHEKCNVNECSDLVELSYQRPQHRHFRGQLRLMSGKVPYKVPVEALSYDYLIDCYLPQKLRKYGLRVPVTK